MSRSLLSVLLLSPVLGWAQLSPITLDLGNGQTALVRGAGACADVVTVNWQLGAVQACADLNIWLSGAASCADSPAADDRVIRTVSAASLAGTRSGSVTFPISDLPMFKTAACPVPNAELVNRVCASTRTQISFLGDCSSVVKNTEQVTVSFDSKPPRTPSLIEVTPRNQGLGVEVDLAPDVFAFRVEAAVAGSGAWVSGPLLAIGAAPVIDGLTNNILYDVRVVAEDAVGNATPPSNVQQGTPVESCGFPCQLRGVNVDGGCAAAGGFAPWGLVVSLWLLWKRRSK